MHPLWTRATPLFLLVPLVACGHAAPPPPAAPVAVKAPWTPHIIHTESSASVIWSTKASLRLMSTWSKCHRTFAVGSGDPNSEVARLSQGCREVTGMHRVGEPFTGEQKAADKPQTFPFHARGGHCYRVYGAAALSVKNLDLLVQDSEGSVLGQDGSDDGAPVVLDAGGICFKVDDDASVVVSVGDGAGAFAVEVWED